jgi:hypothetical protein
MHIALSRDWVVLLPIVVPNLIWALLPRQPTNEPLVPSIDPRLKLLVVLEGAGRVAVFALPFFLECSVQTGFDRVLVGLGALALLVYYVGWARFFIRGRQPVLLFAPLGVLPVPLAVSPVVYFLAFAGLARSPLMAVATAVFGLAHVSLSLKRFSAA